MSAEKKTKTEAKSAPVETIRVGSVKMPIWRNDGKDGPYFKAGTPELSYKDGDAWKESNSYGLRDLVNLVKAAMLAHSAILKLNKAHKAKEPNEASDDDAE